MAKPTHRLFTIECGCGNTFKVWGAFGKESTHTCKCGKVHTTFVSNGVRVDGPTLADGRIRDTMKKRPQPSSAALYDRGDGRPF
jgi:hypothetical protein